MAFHTSSDFQADPQGGSGIRATRVRMKGRRRARRPEEGGFGVAALDLLPHALLVVDGAGRVLDTNVAADRLLARLDGLVLARGGIEARIGRENELLLRAITRVIEAQGEAEVEVLKISRPSRLVPYCVAVAPLRGAGRKAAWGAALFVHDPARPRVPSAEQLSRLHGLTAMEAIVARELASGHSLKEIAKASDVRLNTIRGHLKGVFSKTGTHRQAELVARILSGPPQLAFGAA